MKNITTFQSNMRQQEHKYWMRPHWYSSLTVKYFVKTVPDHHSSTLEYFLTPAIYSFGVFYGRNWIYIFILVTFNEFLSITEVWWVHLSWLPDAHPATVSLPLLNRQEEKTGWKNLWVKIRTGRSHSNYHHEQNRFGLERLVELIAS